MCREAAGERPIVFHQTNSEEELIDWVHEAIDASAVRVAVQCGRL